MKLKITVIFLLSLFALFYFKDYFLIKHAVPPRQDVPRASVEALERFEANLGQLYDYTGQVVKSQKVASLLKVEKTIRVFHFWASWCDPCLNELPDFIKFVKKNKAVLAVDTQGGKSSYEKDVQFFLVSLDFDQEGINKFSKIFPEMMSKDFIQIWDKDNFLSKAFGVNKLPMTIMVYPEGQVVSYEGVLEWSKFSFLKID